MEKFEGVILEIQQLTERVSCFRIGLKEWGMLPLWTPGAHVEVDVTSGHRSYSLICFEEDQTPPQEYLIAVQREPEGDGGSVAMHGLQVGDPVSFSAPKNDFPLDTTRPAVLLAGGIGVTPLISMAAGLLAAEQTFAFHYAGRTKSAMAYHDVLQERFGAAFQSHYDDDETALDLDKIIASLGAAHLYVCGPRGMIDAARAKAEVAGIPNDRVHFELFEAAAPKADDTAFEVEINDGTVFTIPPGKSIIDVLEENDVDVMYDCQRGDCGICQTDVIDGVPDHRDVVLSEAERAAGDVMQICVSRAKSPRLVLDIDGD